MKTLKLDGLTAATYTPLANDGALNLNNINAMVNHIRGQDVAALYVCGSTGEGISLSRAERRQVAEAYVKESGDLPVVVQVGHNSLYEARDLAAHAQDIGAEAVSANAPSYFKVTDVPTLVASMKEIASGAPDLPFFYYHIPHLTGASVDMLAFLEQATKEIPTLAGIKYTAPTLHEFLACKQWNNEQHSILWGSDEMLLPALSMGATGAVGSTYNVMGKTYNNVIREYNANNIEAARQHQSKANLLIRTVYKYPFHPAMKIILGEMGVECGPCRLPQKGLTADQVTDLRRDLDSIKFFHW